jgi:[protein-PII] uridylyltransferase
LRSWVATGGEQTGGLAVIAMGSYARNEVCPRSDIDLLLLHDGWKDRDLQKLV